MKLPIATSREATDLDALWRQVVRARRIVAQTFCEVVEGPGMAALVSRLEGPGGAGDFAIVSEREVFTDASTVAPKLEVIEALWHESPGHRCQAIFVADGLDASAEVEAKLTESGWGIGRSALWRLEAWPGPVDEPKAQIIPARAAMEPWGELLLERARERQVWSDAEKRSAVEAGFLSLDEPRVETLVARRGRLEAMGSVVSLGQVGVVRELYVRPDVRGDGLGRRILSAAIEYCRQAQFEHVLIESPIDAAPDAMLNHAGFRKLEERGYAHRTTGWPDWS
ncbi:MAG: GNAT family N-acetyltransferase [Phycisphaeraceae bacterium]|nr:GNAT family N-acetyltransferase [Phycisphaeraceae bacterium]